MGVEERSRREQREKGEKGERGLVLPKGLDDMLKTGRNLKGQKEREHERASRTLVWC